MIFPNNIFRILAFSIPLIGRAINSLSCRYEFTKPLFWKKISIVYLVMPFLLYSGNANSLDIVEDRQFAEHAKFICSSEPKKGTNYETEVVANGDIQLKIFGKKGGGVEGTYVYKAYEWQEQQKVLVSDQAKSDSEYRTCVTKQMEILRKKKP